MNLISVILPVYNAEKYLSNCIESILDQSYRKFELIIINDGSTDKSEKIISNYCAKDSRIKYIKNNFNAGITSSLIKGVNQSQGNYIARQDADDISKPERLKKQLSWLLEDEKRVLCGTNADFFESKKIIFPFYYKNLSIKKNLKYINCFVHSSVMFKNNGMNYNPLYKFTQDYDLWRRLVIKGEVGNLKEKLVKIRISQNSISVKNRTEQKQFFVLASLNNSLKNGETKLLSFNDVFEKRDIKFQVQLEILNYIYFFNIKNFNIFKFTKKIKLSLIFEIFNYFGLISVISLKKFLRKFL